MRNDTSLVWAIIFFVLVIGGIGVASESKNFTGQYVWQVFSTGDFTPKSNGMKKIFGY